MIAPVWRTPDPSPGLPSPRSCWSRGIVPGGKGPSVLQACSRQGDNSQRSRNCCCPSAAQGQTVGSRIMSGGWGNAGPCSATSDRACCRQAQLCTVPAKTDKFGIEHLHFWPWNDVQLVPFAETSFSFQVYSPRKRQDFAGEMSFIDHGAYFIRKIMVSLFFSEESFANTAYVCNE